MKISVVIPSHNAAPYLAQTIGSVLDQTRPPDDIVIVDDRSDDGSLDLARRLAAAVPSQVRVFAASYGRASRVRNLGAWCTDGDAIMFLDADDVLRPDALGALEEALSRHPGAVAVCPWFRLERIDGRWMERPASCAPRAGQDALSAWLSGWYHPPCSVLWSREALERAGRWDEQAIINDDGDLVMRALVFGAPLVETPRGAAYYRRRPAGEVSITAARFTSAGLADRLRTYEKIAVMLEQEGRLDRYRPAVATAFALVADDAHGRDEALYQKARVLARWYGPALWKRAAAHRRPTRGRTAGSPAAEPREVRWGLDRAVAVLEAAAGAPQAPALRLPRRPAVTAVLPTYNRASLLGRALRSALSQTFEDFELLVVDDGSTDETTDVVRRCADSRVRCLRQPRNAGVSAARNRGMREARADLIAFLDSDDEWLPEKLALQVRRFEGLPERVGLLYGGVVNRDGEGREWTTVPASRGHMYGELLLSNVIHGTSGVMIRRAVVPAVGFFDEQIPAIEDYDYWVRLARFFDIDFVEAPLIRYHDPHAGARKSLDVPANIDARWWFFRKHASEMRRHGVAHLFLRESVRRTLLGRHPDYRAARRLALQAVFEAPLSRMTVATLMRAALPRTQHVRWIQHHAALE